MPSISAGCTGQSTAVSRRPALPNPTPPKCIHLLISAVNLKQGCDKHLFFGGCRGSVVPWSTRACSSPQCCAAQPPAVPPPPELPAPPGVPPAGPVVGPPPGHRVSCSASRPGLAGAVDRDYISTRQPVSQRHGTTGRAEDETIPHLPQPAAQPPRRSVGRKTHLSWGTVNNDAHHHSLRVDERMKERAFSSHIKSSPSSCQVSPVSPPGNCAAPIVSVTLMTSNPILAAAESSQSSQLHTSESFRAHFKDGPCSCPVHLRHCLK